MAPRSPSLVPALGQVLAHTCSLVVPWHCPCGQEGVLLCSACRRLLARGAVRVESCCAALQTLSAARVRSLDPTLPPGVDHETLLPVLALGEYAGDLQRLVLAWKNGGQLHLAARLAPYLAPAARCLAEKDEVSAPLLVPVPSRLGSRLRRGEDHVAELVRALGREGVGVPLPAQGAPGRGQQGLGASQRRGRRIHLGTLRPPRAGRGSAAAILVDDVVTTGSTLRGMHEALASQGLRTLGAVVVAAARVPTRPEVPAGHGVQE